VSEIGTEAGVPPRQVREFVGFAWQDDWTDQVGLLVEALDVTEAKALAQATLGSSFRVSMWNEDDANAPRSR